MNFLEQTIVSARCHIAIVSQHLCKSMHTNVIVNCTMMCRVTSYGEKHCTNNNTVIRPNREKLNKEYSHTLIIIIHCNIIVYKL